MDPPAPAPYASAGMLLGDLPAEGDRLVPRRGRPRLAVEAALGGAPPRRRRDGRERPVPRRDGPPAGRLPDVRRRHRPRAGGDGADQRVARHDDRRDEALGRGPLPQLLRRDRGHRRRLPAGDGRAPTRARRPDVRPREPLPRQPPAWSAARAGRRAGARTERCRSCAGTTEALWRPPGTPQSPARGAPRRGRRRRRGGFRRSSRGSGR